MTLTAVAFVGLAAAAACAQAPVEPETIQVEQPVDHKNLFPFHPLKGVGHFAMLTFKEFPHTEDEYQYYMTLYWQRPDQESEYRLEGEVLRVFQDIGFTNTEGPGFTLYKWVLSEDSCPQIREVQEMLGSLQLPRLTRHPRERALYLHPKHHVVYLNDGRGSVTVDVFDWDEPIVGWIASVKRTIGPCLGAAEEVPSN